MDEQEKFGELLERARAGDSKAFEALLAPILQWLNARLAWRFGLTAADAEDLGQATLLRAWRKLRGFAGTTKAELLAWIFRIAQRLFLSARRLARYGRQELPLEIDPEQPAEEPGSFAEESVASFLGWLRNLPARQRDVLVLFYLGELSTADIAVTLGLKVSRVTALMTRAKDALTQDLRPHCPLRPPQVLKVARESLGVAVTLRAMSVPGTWVSISIVTADGVGFRHVDWAHKVAKRQEEVTVSLLDPVPGDTVSLVTYVAHCPEDLLPDRREGDALGGTARTFGLS